MSFRQSDLPKIDITEIRGVNDIGNEHDISPTKENYYEIIQSPTFQEINASLQNKVRIVNSEP